MHSQNLSISSSWAAAVINPALNYRRILWQELVALLSPQLLRVPASVQGRGSSFSAAHKTSGKQFQPCSSLCSAFRGLVWGSEPCCASQGGDKPGSCRDLQGRLRHAAFRALGLQIFSNSCLLRGLRGPGILQLNIEGQVRLPGPDNPFSKAAQLQGECPWHGPKQHQNQPCCSPIAPPRSWRLSGCSDICDQT